MNYEKIDIELDDEIVEYVRAVATQHEVTENQVFCDILHQHIVRETEKALTEAYWALVDACSTAGDDLAEWQVANKDLLDGLAERVVLAL
jgi:hypothetical protein